MHLHHVTSRGTLILHAAPELSITQFGKAQRELSRKIVVSSVSTMRSDENGQNFLRKDLSLAQACQLRSSAHGISQIDDSTPLNFHSNSFEKLMYEWPKPIPRSVKEEYGRNIN